MLNLKIKTKEIEKPIIQGAMGVGISLGTLSGSVAKEGAMGTISMVGIGYKEADYYKNPLEANQRAFRKELKKARTIAQGNGLIGANIMVVLTDYEGLVKEAVAQKVDYIVSGAGLPLNLPELVADEDILLAPIVSSARALKLINRVWQKKHQRLPDFVVLEGSGAGGHLGFKRDEIEKGKSLEELTKDVVEYLQEVKQATGQTIPLFVAGSVYDGADLKKYRDLGATGLQIGSRFIGTFECDADERFKNFVINSKEEDLVIIQSPVGILGRAINNQFLKEIALERRPSVRCINCLQTCDPRTTPYCISDALIHSAKGEIEQGLVFAGSNLNRIDQMVSVKSILDEIVEEYQAL